MQLFTHELGHNFDLPDGWNNYPYKQKRVNDAYPYKCYPDNKYTVMGGAGYDIRWSTCSAMDFRRHYMKYEDRWCLPGKKKNFKQI